MDFWLKDADSGKTKTAGHEDCSDLKLRPTNIKFLEICIKFLYSSEYRADSKLVGETGIPAQPVLKYLQITPLLIRLRFDRS